MRNKARRSRLAFSGAILVTIALACSDSTAPMASRLHGTYELSTVFDSLTYSDYCSLPTSSTMPPICHDTTVANTGKILDGTVTFGDTIQGTSQSISVTITGVALRETACESCSPGVSQYYSSAATVDRDTPRFQARLFGGALVDLKGAIASPFITGRITYYTYIGCCSQTYYSGMFMMKRQP
jgi:hypothetical protein